MRRILVTGASGFVGRHVLQAFRQAFFAAKILGVGRRTALSVPDGVAYNSLDLVDWAAVHRLIQAFRPTDVLHLAAEASVVRAKSSKFDAWRINFGGLYNLIDAIEQTGEPCNFAFVSSGEIYGLAFNEHCPATERTEPKPIGTYARSKWMGEQLLVRSTEGTCLKPIILRPFNHIGPGQDLAFAVPSFSHQIALIEAGRQLPVVEVGNLSSKRDFLDVSDVVEAYTRILNCAGALDGPHTFNICSGEPRSLQSILMTLHGLSRAAFEVRPALDRTRESEIPVASGDARQLRQITGWAPKIDMATSLARILDAARTQVAGTEVSE